MRRSPSQTAGPVPGVRRCEVVGGVCVLVSWCPGVLVSWWVWCWWGWWWCCVCCCVCCCCWWGLWLLVGVCACLCVVGGCLWGLVWGLVLLLVVWRCVCGFGVAFGVAFGGAGWGLWWFVVVLVVGRPARTDRRRIRKTLLECFTNWLDFDDLWFRFRPCYYYKYEYANYRH
jgi:hypothetical protein